MEFARGLLLKYGWQEGRGLGKLESGISKPIKPKLKFNTEGFGFDSAEQFTHHWWEQAYNTAANNIGVSNTDDGTIAVESLNKTAPQLTTKRIFVSDSEKETLEYRSFKKVAILKDEVLIETALSSNEDNSPCESSGFRNLTDEELFLACRGRTGHKAARHGHKLNGKLARISDQDQMYMLHNKKTKQYSTNNEDEIICSDSQKVHKKSKKDKQKMESLRNDTLVVESGKSNSSKNKTEFLHFTESDLSPETSQEMECFETVKKGKKRKKNVKNEGLHYNPSIDEDKDITEPNVEFYSNKYKDEFSSTEINRCAIKKKKKTHVLEENIQDVILPENVSSIEDFNVSLDRIKIKKKKKNKVCTL